MKTGEGSPAARAEMRKLMAEFGYDPSDYPSDDEAEDEYYAEEEREQQAGPAPAPQPQSRPQPQVAQATQTRESSSAATSSGVGRESYNPPFGRSYCGSKLPDMLIAECHC